MSLLGNIANKEIYDFLRTTTIKNSYFADQSRSKHIKPSASRLVPDQAVPYYKHIAGEYILKDALTVEVTNPKTGIPYPQVYKNTTFTLDSHGEPTVVTPNTDIYEDLDGVFDEMMYVTSLDTQEVIPFTLENLHPEFALEAGATHTKTLEAYKLPSRYFELLCERYPNQVDLIKAIVYPVQITRDLSAEEIAQYHAAGRAIPTYRERRIDYLINGVGNFAICNFDDEILNINERENITSQFRMLVDLIAKRWNVKEYTYEENYATVLWSLMWSILPLGLIAQRYQNIKTPAAHSSHIWDYLISKGLESYKGYLTENQTLFLYKNINYILNNRGSQKITNLLIDELLSDVGLNIKCKTVVLDTTDSLDDTNYRKPPMISTQCQSCAKRTVCHRNITDSECIDYIGVEKLCKAEPIVLTEEFAGASKPKIIDALITEYGYTAEQAEFKYKRSLLWKDAEISEIRDSLDRDQLTDLNGPTSSLDELIQDEHASGLEPEYNQDVVDQQTRELRQVEGTVAPTKILEITQNTVNARFADLFNKFITETLLHLAPVDSADGKTIIDKVTNVYTIYLDDETINYTFTYGRLLAMLYLGTLREYMLDVVLEHCNTDSVYEDGSMYFRVVPKTDEQIEQLKLVNANKMTLIDTTDLIGQPINENDIYRWAPKTPSEKYPIEMGQYISRIYGQEFLTNMLRDKPFSIPIPDQIQLGIAFKFGKPVKQQDLLDKWLEDSHAADKYLPIMPEGTVKALLINDLVYAVGTPFRLTTDKSFLPGKKYYESAHVPYQYVLTPDPEMIFGKDYYECDFTDDEMEDWEWSALKLKVFGVIKNESFCYNNGEIPVVPRYFRWYSDHLQPDEPGKGYDRTVTVLKNLPYPWSPKTLPDPDREVIKIWYDTSKNKTYQLLEIDRYLDIDTILSEYVDLMDNVTDQAQIGEYIGKMFKIYEQIYTLTSVIPSIKTSLAADRFFQCVRCTGKYRVRLTNTARNTSWPIDDTYLFQPEKGITKVATYDDWMRFDKDLYTGCQNVDKRENSTETWGSINSRIIDTLLLGCDSIYTHTVKNDETINKLKELTQHLSSYKVAFINVDSSGKLGDAAPSMLEDSASVKVQSKDYVNISSIELDAAKPHAGGLCPATDGNMYVYTRDKEAVEGKEYFKLAVTSTTTPLPTSHQIVVDQIPLDLDVVYYERANLNPGDKLGYMQYLEAINLYTLLGITDRLLVIDVARNSEGKWFYRTGKRTSTIELIPASLADVEIEDVDPFLDIDTITPEIRKRLKCALYRKTCEKKGYLWSEYVESPELGLALEPYVQTTLIVNEEVIRTKVITDRDNDETVYIDRDNGKTQLWVMLHGVPQPTGEGTTGYNNVYGLTRICRCGRRGPDAWLEDTSVIADVSTGVWNDVTKQYNYSPVYPDPDTGEDTTAYRFKVDVNGHLVHNPDGGGIGVVCEHCHSAVTPGYVPAN